MGQITPKNLEVDRHEHVAAVDAGAADAFSLPDPSRTPPTAPLVVCTTRPENGEVRARAQSRYCSQLAQCGTWSSTYVFLIALPFRELISRCAAQPLRRSGMGVRVLPGGSPVRRAVPGLRPRYRVPAGAIWSHDEEVGVAAEAARREDDPLAVGREGRRGDDRACLEVRELLQTRSVRMDEVDLRLLVVS